jgi:hypothetical protein
MNVGDYCTLTSSIFSRFQSSSLLGHLFLDSDSIVSQFEQDDVLLSFSLALCYIKNITKSDCKKQITLLCLLFLH